MPLCCAAQRTASQHDIVPVATPERRRAPPSPSPAAAAALLAGERRPAPARARPSPQLTHLRASPYSTPQSKPRGRLKGQPPRPTPLPVAPAASEPAPDGAAFARRAKLRLYAGLVGLVLGVYARHLGLFDAPAALDVHLLPAGAQQILQSAVAYELGILRTGLNLGADAGAGAGGAAAATLCLLMGTAVWLWRRPGAQENGGVRMDLPEEPASEEPAAAAAKEELAAAPGEPGEPAPEPAPEPEPGTPPRQRGPRPIGSAVCPGGHVLRLITAAKGACDLCGRKVKAGQRVTACEVCNYYACIDCAGAGSVRSGSVSPRARRRRSLSPTPGVTSRGEANWARLGGRLLELRVRWPRNHGIANRGEPTHFSGPLCEGSVYFRTRATQWPADVAYFEGRKRLVDMQFQLRLKKKVTGMICCGFEGLKTDSHTAGTPHWSWGIRMAVRLAKTIAEFKHPELICEYAPGNKNFQPSISLAFATYWDTFFVDDARGRQNTAAEAEAAARGGRAAAARVRHPTSPGLAGQRQQDGQLPSTHTKKQLARGEVPFEPGLEYTVSFYSQYFDFDQGLTRNHLNAPKEMSDIATLHPIRFFIEERVPPAASDASGMPVDCLGNPDMEAALKDTQGGATGRRRLLSILIWTWGRSIDGVTPSAACWLDDTDMEFDEDEVYEPGFGAQTRLRRPEPELEPEPEPEVWEPEPEPELGLELEPKLGRLR